MPCRQTEYAVKERRKIIESLGPKCRECGEIDMDLLELDHINGRDWVLKDFSSSARVARYKREADEGKLQVLCAFCNKQKYARSQQIKPEAKEVDEIRNPPPLVDISPLDSHITSVKRVW